MEEGCLLQFMITSCELYELLLPLRLDPSMKVVFICVRPRELDICPEQFRCTSDVFLRCSTCFPRDRAERSGVGRLKRGLSVLRL